LPSPLLPRRVREQTREPRPQHPTVDSQRWRSRPPTSATMLHARRRAWKYGGNIHRGLAKNRNNNGRRPVAPLHDKIKAAISGFEPGRFKYLIKTALSGTTPGGFARRSKRPNPASVRTRPVVRRACGPCCGKLFTRRPVQSGRHGQVARACRATQAATDHRGAQSWHAPAARSPAAAEALRVRLTAAVNDSSDRSKGVTHAADTPFGR